ncbi:DUF559 domain-containing protein [Ferruginibacter sp. SUN106]|uniref:DUF559 domain-containing protein n=1 Tax=Ferruginibacter sp. SUN106 TaxID=2978348 RepID=UPI003D35AE05
MREICFECRRPLDFAVVNYSVNNFGIPLCQPHQQWVREMENFTTPQTLAMYFALKQRGVPAEIEKFDGFKTIDIAVPEAKINIEIDGGHHNFDPRQALSDLQRTYFSFLKGYLTLRIPNSLIEWNLEETADYLVEFMNVNNYRNWSRY